MSRTASRRCLTGRALQSSVWIGSALHHGGEGLEQLGYATEAFFSLPEECWIDHYYQPMQDRFEAYLERNNHSDDARGVVGSEQLEIDLYQKFSPFFSYGMYVARVPAMI